jgi:hypothetical protein
VLTGYGRSQVARLPAGVSAYPDLLAAAEAILAQDPVHLAAAHAKAAK